MFNRMDISKGGFKPPLLTTLCFTLVAWSISAHSQPDSLWTRYYNDGESGYRETCQELIRTTDGGFMIGGRCYSEAEDLRPQWFQDYYLVKVDSIGTEQWSRAYDLSHRHESFGDVVQTPDEEYLIVGESHNGRYANILRINSDSDTSWSRYYGDGELREIISMPDGTAVAAGQTSEFAEFGGADAYLVKIDEEGEVIWRGVYGGRAHDLFSSIKNHDGGFLATGLAWMVAGILAKIDSTGELEWLHYINPTDGADALNDFTVLFDGTIIAVGYADSRDGLLVKCNSEGELVWSRIYEDNDSIHDIVPLCGGGYVLICGSRAFRIDDLGDEIWEIEAEQFDFDYFHCILPMDDGGYLIGGNRFMRFDGGFSAGLIRTEPDTVVLPFELETEADAYDFGELDVDSTSVWEFEIYNTGRRYAVIDTLWFEGDTSVFSCALDLPFRINPEDTCLVLIKFHPSADTAYSATLVIPYGEDQTLEVVLSGNGYVNSVSDEPNVLHEFALYEAYPNPFNNAVQIHYSLPDAAEIKIAVYDITGRETAVLFNGDQIAGKHQTYWSSQGVASGSYVLRLESSGVVKTQKLVHIK